MLSVIVRRISLAASLATLTTLAANAGGQALDEGTMKLLLEQVQQVQGCVAELEPGALASLQAEGEALVAEVGALCRAGKRSDAQARALAFGQQFEASAEMQQLMTCAKDMNSILPLLMPTAAQLAESGEVCDLPLER